jgi:hypothetical protein
MVMDIPHLKSMPKYEEIYHLFLQDIKSHQSYTEACLNFGDRFACEMLKYLNWPEEEAEYVMLPQNAAIPNVKGKRISVLESNLTSLEKVSYWQNGYCCFGLRLSLLFRCSQPARVSEVMFVIPLFIQPNITEAIQPNSLQFILKTNPLSDPIIAENYDQFFDRISDQIKIAIIDGVQNRLDQSEMNLFERKYGIVLSQVEPSQ